MFTIAAVRHTALTLAAALAAATLFVSAAVGPAVPFVA